ncbi:MAG: RNA 2',3'-cyclic phosphodiesterase [Anaerolineaceae bacterium]|nr:RNA 2',3'-cyclic phosphodiesterase [Anaerolineaceae bacterium]
MQTKRLFIAAELPDALIENIHLVVKTQWPVAYKGIKWIPLDQYHLTLKFLGDTPIDLIPAIRKICEKSVKPGLSFPIEISGFGVFPDQNHPTVLWAGIQPAHALIDFQKSLDKSLNQINIPQEKRPFKPHLTLARIKDFFPKQKLPQLLSPLQNGSQVLQLSTFIQKITLFESQLSKQGPVYQALWTQLIQ